MQRPRAVQWYLELHPMVDAELPPVGAVEDERIAAALAFMHDRYAESPSLMTVSKKAHMSPFHFQRTFSMMVGTTPKQCLFRRQMQIAKWMLRLPRSGWRSRPSSR